MKPLDHVCLHVHDVAPFRDALAIAEEVARRSGGVLELVAAPAALDPAWRGAPGGRELERALRAELAARRADAERIARAALGASRVRATTLREGDPSHRLVEHALARAADLLVVSAPDGVPERLDRAVQHLFRRCPAPVWAVHPGRGSFPRRVLAAVEPGAPGTPARRLARRVVEFALAVARDGAADVHVAHAWTLPGEAVLRARFGALATHAPLEEQRANAAARVAELLVDCGATNAVELHLARGEPAEAIAAVARLVDAELVVVGSTGRTGVAGFLLGNTAEEVTARVARSVAVVKPDDFVSPVATADGAFVAA